MRASSAARVNSMTVAVALEAVEALAGSTDDPALLVPISLRAGLGGDERNHVRMARVSRPAGMSLEDAVPLVHAAIAHAAETGQTGTADGAWSGYASFLPGRARMRFFGPARVTRPDALAGRRSQGRPRGLHIVIRRHPRPRGHGKARGRRRRRRAPLRPPVPREGAGRMSRAGGFVRVDHRSAGVPARIPPRPLLGYSHVRQVGRLDRGPDVSFAPNVSFRNAERITIGAGTHIGEHSMIWAGNSTGRITFGEKCLLAPNVTVTASNYGIDAGHPGHGPAEGGARHRDRPRRVARRERGRARPASRSATARSSARARSSRRTCPRTASRQACRRGSSADDPRARPRIQPTCTVQTVLRSRRWRCPHDAHAQHRHRELQHEAEDAGLPRVDPRARPGRARRGRRRRQRLGRRKPRGDPRRRHGDRRGRRGREPRLRARREPRGRRVLRGFRAAVESRHRRAARVRSTPSSTSRRSIPSTGSTAGARSVPTAASIPARAGGRRPSGR